MTTSEDLTVTKDNSPDPTEAVAVIGMAGQFPGARTLSQLWRNLAGGVESIVISSDEALAAAGVPLAQRHDPNWVAAGAHLDDVDLFDADFFGLAPRQAEIIDPQHRRFLQSAWHALEDAGYDPAAYPGRIGVFASASSSSYAFHLLSHPDLANAINPFDLRVANEKDYLATRTSYLLDLKGPSLAVQTACSSSLVAVHLACNSLLNGESDMALAGGVSATAQQQLGYTFVEDGILSRDGHCRPFDAEASGTVFSSGLGIVILKRLEDALRDGDTLRAVIRGTAINNDGSLKVGYTAPSVQGQQNVVLDALADAEVDAETISYIETHGTGTALGDPIEIRALSQAFAEAGHTQGRCAIGSIKSNFGHADTAAGIAGLIKTILALEHQQLPPSLHFEHPSPQIDFASSPFFVNTELADWPASGQPRRAGISSFGIGGTNAHAIVEEAPPAASPSASRPWQLVMLSARSTAALERATVNLVDYIQDNPATHLPDVAHTLMVGRRGFEHRRAWVCRNPNDLLTKQPLATFAAVHGQQPPISFLFPGQGAQALAMAAQLYTTEPAFRVPFDRCEQYLEPHLEQSLSQLLFKGPKVDTGNPLEETEFAQPALFAVEYSLARMWMTWGLTPRAMLGHSLGEYVAACFAGVFELGDALALVATRGRLMQQLPRGAMLAVLLPAEAVEPLLGDSLSIAALNGAERTVVSGPTSAITTLQERLNARDIGCRRLETSHAFHSSMMDPIQQEFKDRVGAIELQPPKIPFLSNLTGTWIRPEEATDSQYWALHLRQPVRFSQGLAEILTQGPGVLLEVGPGRSLSTLARQHPDLGPEHLVVTSLPSSADSAHEQAHVLSTLARMWGAGAAVDSAGFYSNERRRRIPLPTYPFEERRFWLEAADTTHSEKAISRPPLEQWFYQPNWQLSKATNDNPAQINDWLLFLDHEGLGSALHQRLLDAGQRVTTVEPASAELASFSQDSADRYRLVADRPEDYHRLIKLLHQDNRLPNIVAHLWSVTGEEASATEASRPEVAMTYGLHSLQALIQALAEHAPRQQVRISIVANQLFQPPSDAGNGDIHEAGALAPVKATVIGLVETVHLENPELRVRAVDVDHRPTHSIHKLEDLDRLIAELASEDPTRLIALRDGNRWIRSLEPRQLGPVDNTNLPLRRHGVYLITGGLGGLGFIFAEHLAQTYQAKLVLLGRTPVPPRASWDTFLGSSPEGLVIAQIHQLEAAGADVETVSADVTNRDRMAEVVADIKQRFGALHGVIHAAGVAGGGLVALADRERTDAVLRPKVLGTLVLADVVLADAAGPMSPDFFLLCSSTLGTTSAAGQADYCAANAFLDAFAEAQTGASDTRTLAIAWDGWAGIGMTAPPQPTPDEHPGESDGRSLEHPLLDRCITESETRRVYVTALDERRMWALREHRIFDRPSLSGTTLIEIARAAYADHIADTQNAGDAIEIRDLIFLTPLVVGADGPRHVYVELETVAAGTRCSIFTERTAPDSTKHRLEHAQGSLTTTSTHPAKHPIDTITQRCDEVLEITEELPGGDQQLMQWGPRWQSLKRLHVGTREGLGALQLPDRFIDDTHTLALHPALFDVALAFAQRLGDQDHLALPLSYDRIVIHHSLPPKLFSHVRLREEPSADDETLTFDAVLLAENGAELVLIEGFMMKRVPQDMTADALGAVAAIDPASTPTGIQPSEGVEALRRVLADRTISRVLVSPRDLPAVYQQSRSAIPTAAAATYEALPTSHPRPNITTPYVTPRDALEQRIAEVWQGVLGIDRVGIRDSFFELGGDSLLLVRVRKELEETFGLPLPITQLFRYSTIAALAESGLLAKSTAPVGVQDTSRSSSEAEAVAMPDATNAASFLTPQGRSEIAIIGMSGRFPGANNLQEYWHNLREGLETISFFTAEELEAEGHHPSLVGSARYIRALPMLEDAEWFDAKHFGINPREAETIDPQHRVFLETAWEALENAGYDPERFAAPIGMFAGCGVSRYWMNLVTNLDRIDEIGVLPLVLGNDKDYLPTRASFKLNLQGPTVNVQSACSTSLIAVHLACRSLQAGECDMALAGGVSLAGTRKEGYLFEDGGMFSPDGHCRPFDAKAAGTIFGSGSGVVVLKRLDQALADGDSIQAVVKGSAINNDGSNKVGFTAPGVDGQVQVVSRALADAQIKAETVSYVEAHGTATNLGDPIEVAALTEVFGKTPSHTCALGSVKSNIGHSDAAAGVAGLLKTVLALKHRQIPASLNYEEPNPQIDFAAGPFHVNTTLSEWQTNGSPRRAGVSAFGIGGSNAHLVIEEAPPQEPSSPSRPWQLLALSARTPAALEAATGNLAHFLEENPEINLADAAFTLQLGRRAFAERRIVVNRDRDSAIKSLNGSSPDAAMGPFTGSFAGENRSIVFLFPGQGAQYVDMGRELYGTEDVFRRRVDQCCELLEPHLGRDLRSILFPSPTPDEDPEEVSEAAAELLQQTRFTQPALFVIEYALACQWAAWGVHPTHMLGHSVGEYVAACLAGVFSLPDALALVAARGRLMHSVDPGAMLSVAMRREALESVLAAISADAEVSLAAINGPERLVVAGNFEAIGRLETELANRQVETRRLRTSHAFHSPMMEPILDDFRQELGQVVLQEPRESFISNVTGRAIAAQDAQDIEYWVRHLRQTVQFSASLDELCAGDEERASQILLEVGPGRTLGSLARRHPAAKAQPVVYSMRHAREWASDQGYLLAARGRLWQAGYEADWMPLYDGQRRRRIPLPTYAFERQHYFVEPGDLEGLAPRGGVRQGDLADWFHVPSWRPSDLTVEHQLDAERDGPCLVFLDQTGLGEALRPRLDQHLNAVTYVRIGDEFGHADDGVYTVDPGQRNHFETLLKELRKSGQWPKTLLFLWGVTARPTGQETSAEYEQHLDHGIYCLFHLAQLLEEIGEGDPLHLVLISTGVHHVDGSEALIPEKATLVGPATVIPQEYRNIRGHSIDLEPQENWEHDEDLLDQLLEEISNDQPELAIAYRRGQRWVEAYEPVPLAAKTRKKPHFRTGGCYLISGGLGGLGSTFARHLAEEAQARLILTGRSPLPAREAWPQWLKEHTEDDSTYRKITLVQELEALGAEVMVGCADITDHQGMTDVVAEARKRFGAIHGVLHAAGLPSGTMMQNKNFDTVVQTLGPKVHGTRILESVLADEPLELFILFSSSGALLGGLGYFDYCAANAFLDAFAHARTATGAYTQSINWGAWQEVGMAVVSNLGFTSEEERRIFLSQSIKPAEGLEIFHRVLDRRIPQIAVWPMNFQLSIENSRLLTGLEDGTDDEQTSTAHPRPHLSTEYSEPVGDMETTLAGIWQSLLGIDQLGRKDDFFELGADSLLATQVISRVRRKLGVSLSLSDLYRATSIETLAELVEEQSSEQQTEINEIDEVEALLGEVEAMSDSDLEALLAEPSGGEM